ncbi:helix-turn-helix domain-containing protein [Anabaena sp. UHCC 0187]|uniref:helix-turn-helix domain-containing protein n=1 Tax=Anabaena sp. UHCC 0187 TaxID=2590018 RepID=UPI00158051BC|nr:helix-turn-helix domain-containing protein [Anabaena sp. UHCC 0187]
MYNQPGRGCKSKFNPEQEETIKEFVKQEPSQLNQVGQKVKEEWGIISSKKTIQRILKTLKMS